MSFQDMLAKLGGMFGGGEPQQPAELQVSDPGAQSAALAQQMMQVLPALQRRGVLGLGRR